MSPPLEQSMEALFRANEIRVARAVIKRRLHTAKDRYSAMRACARLINDPVPAITSMTVGDLLASCRQVGPATAARFLRPLAIPGTVLVGRNLRRATRRSLSERERERLVSALKNAHRRPA